ncbi:MAG: interleukin-like EMT inducer domain-containing protein [Caldilineaceae bacterium]
MRRFYANTHLRALLLYALLALLLTWPLATRITTHVPGDGIDDPALAWNLWWVQERLINQLNPDIFHADWMFHPIDINLAFYTLTPLNGLLSVPLQSAFGLIVASNLLLLASFVLGAYGAFLLTAELLVGQASQLAQPKTEGQVGKLVLHLAALLAGAVYGFASSKLFYASLGQFNIASSHWIPFCLFYVVRLYQARNLRAAFRNGAWAALFLIFQAWAELTYASFLLIFIAIFFLWHLFTRYRHLLRPYFAPAPYLLAGLLFGIGLAPFLWAMLPDMRTEGDFFASGGGFADLFSADLAGYLMPTRLHPFIGNWTASLPFDNNKGQQIYVGYVALLLAGLGFWSARRNASTRRWSWFWLSSLLIFWLLTLGPHLRWMGSDLPIGGPFALVSRLPFFSGNRYPSRYSVMVMICAAVLVGFGTQRLLGWLQARRGATTAQIPAAAAILLGLFVLEHLSIPLPINNSVTPPIYDQIAADAGDFTVLELPTGWRNGAYVLGKSDELIMMQQWYQSVYGKRRLGGNTSRNPAYKFDYFVNAPLIGDLIGLMNADRAWIAPEVAAHWAKIAVRNREMAGPVLDFLGVRYVTLRVDKSPEALLRFVDEVLPVTLMDEWQGPDWKGADSTIRLYRVNPAPVADEWQIDLAQPAGNLYLAEGWMPTSYEEVRYAVRQNVELLLDLPETGGQLEIELYGPAAAVEIWLAGQRIGQTMLSDMQTPQVMTMEIPPQLATALVDRLELRFSQAVPVTDVQVGELSLLAYSAGEEIGKSARIFVNGRNVAPDERGYNLVAIGPDGAALESVAFDTNVAPESTGAATASQQMADWLAQWPNGTVIAGAVRDEASAQLDSEAVDALARLGVTTDLRGKFRWSHAFIATVGGTAVEAASLLQPAIVSEGLPTNGEFVSGGVGKVQWRRR